ncbi:MAG: cytochrome P450 [Bacteroidota bacterium]
MVETVSGPVTGHDWWAMLTDRAYLENPYPQLRRLQDQGPVHLDQQSGIYFVLGHEAFANVVKSPRIGRDTHYWKPGWNNDEYRQRDPVGFALYSGIQPQMINVDGADHHRMRGMWEAAFKAQAIKDLTPMIQAEADKLLSRLPDEGEIDIIRDFAGPMPLRVLRNLLALPDSMDDTIRRWSEALIRVADVMVSDEEKKLALEALEACKDYLRRFLAERRAAGDTSLTSIIIRAQDDGVLTEEETLVNMVSLLIAGHETTVTLIGNGLKLLLDNPAQMARLRADRSLVRSAVEEFLRCEPGGNMILRVAREDVEIGGTLIPAGSPLLGMIGAVNRDPARFADPDSVDVGRQANPHYTFGGGPHVCLGAPLARLEGQVAFNALLDRWPSITPAGKAEWRVDRLNARGLSCLPVRVGRG